MKRYQGHIVDVVLRKIFDGEPVVDEGRIVQAKRCELPQNGKQWPYLMLLLLLVSTAGLAQTDSSKVNQLSVGLNFMTHGEACGGGMPRTDSKTIEAEDRSSFLLGRTRINVDYQRSGLQVHAIIQNKAVWGSNGNQTLGLYEGWAKISAKNGLFAQLGRVALSYDDERIIGPNDFAVASKTHDMARVGYEGHGHKAHVILAYNQNSGNVYNGTYYVDGAQPYKNMQTVWYHYDVPKFPLGVSLLFMNMGLQTGKNDTKEWDYKTNPARTVYQQMYGGYVKYHPNHLTLEGSYYRQAGKIVTPEMTAPKIDAWMASVKATISPTDKYGLTVGYDYLSGDDFVPDLYGGKLGMMNHEVFRGFAPLYGSNKKFYGIMDYFYESAYIHTFTPGLQNVFIGPYFKPNAKFACRAMYHYMAVATKISDLNRTLGHCIDLQASYQFTKDISLMAGYTQMHGTETMDHLKQGEGDKSIRWGWFSLVISPSLFTTKW